MDLGTVIDIVRNSLYNMILVSAPILLSSLIVGLIISILQATTQIQEQTLSFVPKILAIFGALIILGPWMLKKLMDFTTYLFNLIPYMIK